MKNILLIDNDNSNIQLINAVLEDDYFLEIAENSYKGYQLALRTFPDLIIYNKSLIDNDSNEIFNRMSTDSFFSSIPVIYINDNRTKDKKLPQYSDFEYFIKKPFKGPELQKLVKISIDKYESVRKKSEKKLNDLRGSISFSLPHEFFTPLNGIIGFSDILLKDIDNLNKTETKQMLKYIQKDAIRLKKLTENFLAFAQLEMIANDSESVELLKKSYYFNPNEIITATAKLVASECGRDEDLILELDNIVIRMSEGYLRKVITEITDNAFKFSTKGTPVIISTLSNDTSVMISVSDSGRGMSPEQISSVGAYMQFNRKMHEQQGSGLGLIISMKIVELHGGEFNIESIGNEGTKIIIIFDN